MKNLFFKELLKTISGSKRRFFALFAIVALGCGFFAGLLMSGIDMRYASDEYFNKTNLMDMRIVSTLGFSEDDLDEVIKIEGVKSASESYSYDAMVNTGDKTLSTRIHSLQDRTVLKTSDSSSDTGYKVETICDKDTNPQYENDVDSLGGNSINQLVLKEGNWPTANNECLISYDLKETTNVKIGDKIVVQNTTDDLDDWLTQTEYTVCGKISSSFYCCASSLGTTSLGSGDLDQYIYVLPSAFVDNVTITDLYLRLENPKNFQNMSKEYLDYVAGVKDDVSKLAETRQKMRTQKLKDDAQKELDENLQKFNDEKLSAYSKLNDAKSILDASKLTLDNGKNELEAARIQADEQFASAQTQIDSTRMQTQSALDELLKIDPSTLPDDERIQWYIKVETCKQTLAALDTKQAELDAQKEETYATLDEKTRELQEGQNSYNSGLSDYQSGKAKADSQFADAQKEIDKAQEKINEIENAEWITLTREETYGVKSYDMDASRIDSIARIFPLIFFLVAALVALTTMTRMIEEQRQLIGTFKALGYSRRRITNRYLIYAGIASVLGAAFGIAILSQVLPFIVMYAYAIIYFIDIPPFLLPIDWLSVLLSGGVGVAITLLTSYLVARKTLRTPAATLMLPTAPKPGKRIVLEHIKPIWTRLSFLHKVTFRNIFLDKKRFFMTVIGITGCTGLLLVGLGLSNSINDIIDVQFTDLTHYNTTLTYDDDAHSSDVSQIENELNKNEYFSGYTNLYTKSMMAFSDSNDDLRFEIRVVEDVDKFKEFITLRHRLGHETIDFNKDSVVITEKLATQLNIKAKQGFQIAELDDKGNKTAVTYDIEADDIAENYVQHYIYMGSDAYEKITGKNYYANTFFINRNTQNYLQDDMDSVMHNVDSVKTITYTDQIITLYKESLRSVNLVVVVLVVSAALLAFIVLYNLININITERVREIATLKVLGFRKRELKNYIFREVIILAIIGALLGLIFGFFLEGFVITTAEVDVVMFGREIHLLSYVISFVLTIIFTLIVLFFMGFKLNKINMVESLKSID
ncbi:MAG: FtsX-like permease family protein [Coriobacteriales bacterium]|nr:FtsX-like permease family protein [Coriobacteriales bacterium]